MLGYRLKSYREYATASEKELADFLDVSVEEYREFELDITSPNIDQISDLAGFYGVTTDDIYGFTRKISLHDPNYERVITMKIPGEDIRFPELTWDEKELVYNYRKLFDKEEFITGLLKKVEHEEVEE